MDAITFLRNDHQQVLAMLDELERVPVTGRAVTPEDLAARHRLVTELIIAESAHEAVEEQYFWPSVKHWLQEGNQLAAPAVEQETAAKHVLQKLEKMDPQDAQFEMLVSQVIAGAREHIGYEEREVWPVMAQQVAVETLEEIGEKMAVAKKMAPTRPHPHTPASPAVLKTVGVAAAAVDKVRDAATGRGKTSDD